MAHFAIVEALSDKRPPVNNRVEMDCGSAEVAEIPHQNPIYAGLYKLARVQVANLAQEQAYLPFMGRELFSRFQSGDAVSSWSIGDPAHFFNAVASGELVGVVDLLRQADYWMLVESFYVIPACQRKGVGQKLWDACRAAAQKQGVKGLRVVGLTRNKIATPFYATKLALHGAGAETLTIGGHAFPAIRYEEAFANTSSDRFRS